MSLFRRDIEPRCAYCQKGSVINEREAVCPRKGVVAVEYHCSRFRYDPLKRVPPKPLAASFAHLKDEDFTL
jgi:hypothetical protein